MEYEEGGRNDFVHKLRGRVKFPNLVLKRGITHEEALHAMVLRLPGRRPSATTSSSRCSGPDVKPVRRWAFGTPSRSSGPGPTFNAGADQTSPPRRSRSPTTASS